RTVSTTGPGKTLGTAPIVERRRCLWSIEDPQITRMSQLTGGLWMTVDNSAHMLCTTVCARNPARRGGVREGSIHRMMHPGGHLCGSVWIVGATASRRP